MYDLIDRPTDRLPPFERTVLDRTRRWVHAMTLAGAPPATCGDQPFHGAMHALDAGSRDTLVIERPCFASVSEVEAIILGIWRLARADRLRQAADAASGLVDAASAARLVSAMARALPGLPG